jgi:response regulator RpfG family c-di-GMP phosphodiesterase
MMEKEKVLLVDDDQNLLASMRRQFHKKLNLVTAPGGEDALTTMQHEGPFAVVVSDMQMPFMDGVEFLSRVSKESPDTVRIMLTGNADLQTAVNAVNEGQIFRFLTKPCEQDLMLQTIEAGLRQYRLATAERELLHKTLRGAVNLLTDVLSLVNPLVFSRASRLKRYVHDMVKSLGLGDAWSYELAAMMSQLGFITLSSELAEKALLGEELDESEQTLMGAHPQNAAQLIQHIPRLEAVAGMVKQQDGSGELPADWKSLKSNQKAALGGHILKVAIAYDQLLHNGKEHDDAVAWLKESPQDYDPGLVESLDAVGGGKQEIQILSLSVADLKPGMIIDQDVTSTSGVLYVAKGQEVSSTLFYRLLGLEESGMLSGKLRVVQRISSGGGK